MLVVRTHFEGSLSPIFDVGLSFCFIVCRRLHFANILKKITKVFCYKMKNYTLIQKSETCFPASQHFLQMLKIWCMQA